MTTVREFIANNPLLARQQVTRCQADLDQCAATLRECVAGFPSSEGLLLLTRLREDSTRRMIMAHPDALAMVFALADLKYSELFVSLMEEVEAK